MRHVDAWRLTGPNLQTREPAVLVDVAFEDGDDQKRGVELYFQELARMTSALGIETSEHAARFHRGGVVLTFVAPLDLLLPATDAGEWAAHSASAILLGQPADSLSPRQGELELQMSTLRSPRLPELRALAKSRGLAFLWDDSAVSIGLGAKSRVYETTALPRAYDIPSTELGAIPVALISGTNGKTTSTRLVAKMAREAGFLVGSTSTDGCHVGDERLDRGDFTGPMGARMVLRHPKVTMAILETARGGILRRGLAVESADAALLTNVSDDHLGDYGVDDVETMARVKAVLGTVVGPNGRVVLNADDSQLMALAGMFVAPLILFGLDPDSATIRGHRAQGGEAWLVRGETIIRAKGPEETALLAVSDVPLCMGGAARYNVANVLGASALAASLGIDESVIVRTLRAFDPNTDNPGRGNLFEIGGVTLLLDFGHNPRGVSGAMELANSLRDPGTSLTVIAGHAGDRLDDNIRDVAREVFAGKPERVLLRDLAGYLRGREAGEVPGIFRAELLLLGMAPERVTVAESEVSALAQALNEAGPGDVVVILAHVEEEGVKSLLEERGATPGLRRSPAT